MKISTFILHTLLTVVILSTFCFIEYSNAEPKTPSLSDILSQTRLKTADSRTLWISKPKDLSEEANYWKIFHEDSTQNELLEFFNLKSTIFRTIVEPECITHYPMFIQCSTTYSIGENKQKFLVNLIIPHANFEEHVKHRLIKEYQDILKKTGKEIYKLKSTINSLKVETKMYSQIEESTVDNNISHCYSDILLPHHSTIAIKSKGCLSVDKVILLSKELDSRSIANFLLGPKEVTGEEIKLLKDTKSSTKDNKGLTGKKKFINDLLAATE